MKQYVGLDVSMKKTAGSIRCDGLRVWRGTCVPNPAVIAQRLRKRAARAERVVF